MKGVKIMNNSIQPTVELATNNGNGYAYPVYPMMGGFGNGGFGGYGSDFIWVILLLALFGGWGNNGNGGFGGNSFDNGYAWLSNGQKEIMQNTNQGFDTLHLSNQLDTVNNGIYSLSNQLCNCCADMNSTVSNGFYNAEVSACNRQMANMNQLFGLSTQVSNASADNRLGIQDLKSTVISENCSDREVLRQIGQDIITNQNVNSQKIIDEIFRDRLDEKDDKIAELNRQLQMADLRASQIAQTQAITSNIYNELKNCPVGTVPVYGNTPIFTCPNNNGCGCGFNTTSQFI
jgi:hypothetical protein